MFEEEEVWNISVKERGTIHCLFDFCCHLPIMFDTQVVLGLVFLWAVFERVHKSPPRSRHFQIFLLAQSATVGSLTETILSVADLACRKIGSDVIGVSPSLLVSSFFFCFTLVLSHAIVGTHWLILYSSTSYYFAHVHFPGCPVRIHIHLNVAREPCHSVWANQRTITAFLCTECLFSIWTCHIWPIQAKHVKSKIHKWQNNQ